MGEEKTRIQAEHEQVKSFAVKLAATTEVIAGTSPQAIVNGKGFASRTYGSRIVNGKGFAEGQKWLP